MNDIIVHSSRLIWRMWNLLVNTRSRLIPSISISKPFKLIIGILYIKYILNLKVVYINRYKLLYVSF